MDVINSTAGVEKKNNIGFISKIVSITLYTFFQFDIKKVLI